jgi:hypothetical protein
MKEREILDRVTDKVLAYRAKPRTRKAKRRARRSKKAQAR